MKRLLMCGLATMSLLAACTNTGTAIPASGNADPTPNVEVDPTRAPAATAEVATAPPTAAPTAEPSASVAKVRESIRGCDSYGTVMGMVIVELRNEGTGWAELMGGDYTVYDDDENVVGTGSFTYSFPRYLAPGATGYLADTGYFDDTKVAKLKRVEADGSYDNVELDDVIQLKTAKVKIKRESYGDGIHTTGTITNESTEDVRSAHVGSFFLDGKGRPIGFAYTNLVENLTAGKTKGFETIDSSCAVKQSSVKKTVTLAGDDNF